MLEGLSLYLDSGYMRGSRPGRFMSCVPISCAFPCVCVYFTKKKRHKVTDGTHFGVGAVRSGGMGAGSWKEGGK